MEASRQVERLELAVHRARIYLRRRHLPQAIQTGGPQALPPPADACTELMRVIEDRRENPDEGSYTNKLLSGGDNRILKKIGEESAEFVMACKDDNPEEIAGEAADILFHLQVALAHHGVSWRQVQEVLAARRGAPRRHQESD